MKKNYKGIWTLLAVAFAIVFGLSAIDAEEIQLGPVKLKSSRMFTRVLGSRYENAPPAPPPPVTAADIKPVKRDTAAAQQQPDTMPKTILFFGDSMLEGLSPRLAAYCQASGHKLYTVIWYSSTSERWGQSDKLVHYMRTVKPDYVFISLGANEMFVNRIIENRTGYVKKILADIGSVPYVWIGPPNWKEDTGVNRMVADNVRPGCFFLSNGMHFERKKDGAHPTAPSAALWMDSIVRWMPEHCAHPIRLNTPTAKTARPVKVYIHQPDER